MATSSFERLLLTRVDRVLARTMNKLFGWLYKPLFGEFDDYISGLKSLYIDYDTWEDEGTDLDDSQLYNLGLGVDKINDDKAYWDYAPRNDRGSGGRRRRPRAPEWV